MIKTQIRNCECLEYNDILIHTHIYIYIYRERERDYKPQGGYGKMRDVLKKCYRKMLNSFMVFFWGGVTLRIIPFDNRFEDGIPYPNEHILADNIGSFVLDAYIPLFDVAHNYTLPWSFYSEYM